MREKKQTPRPAHSVAIKLAALANNITEHTTNGEIHAALTEAVETVLSSNTDSIAREATLFALLRFITECEDNGNTLSALAASIAFAYTDMGTDAEGKLWRQWTEGKAVRQ
jgi:hypothetical protein